MVTKIHYTRKEMPLNRKQDFIIRNSGEKSIFFLSTCDANLPHYTLHFLLKPPCTYTKTLLRMKLRLLVLPSLCVIITFFFY